MTTPHVATDRLTLALLGMAARGERTHCSDPTTYDYYWLSEHTRNGFSGSRRGYRPWPGHG